MKTKWATRWKYAFVPSFMALTIVASAIDATAQGLPSGGGGVNGILRRGPDGQLTLDPLPSAPTSQIQPPSKPQSQPQPPSRKVVAPSEPPKPQSPPKTVAAPSAPLGLPAPSVRTLAPVACAPQAVTCIEIASSTDQPQVSVPVTFGQPFREGDLPAGSRLSARTAAKELVPVQMDGQTSFPNGSLRFAVLSSVLPQLGPREKQVLNLFKDTVATPDRADDFALPADFTLEAKANVYSPQVTLVTFGNRKDHQGGTPFSEGEQIVLTLGDTPDEQFPLTITAPLAGGGWPTLTKIAAAFRDLINSRSKSFTAYKVGEGDGYEHLWITSRDPAAKPFGVDFSYTGPAKIKAVVSHAYAPPQTVTAKLRPAIDNALVDGRHDWLKGSVAREVFVAVPFTDASGMAQPQLTARFNVRWFPDGKRVRTDVILENDYAYERAPGNLIYDLSIIQQGREVFSVPAFTQYHHTRWHKVVWWGEEPKSRLRHNIRYFLDSRSVWNYDNSLHLSDQAMSRLASLLATAKSGPMSNSLITYYMPSTGGRADIGPLPEWSAMYLVSQDPRAEIAVYANADAGAAIPIHYRDKPRDLPVSLDDHPGLAMLFGKPRGNDAFPAMTAAETPWTTDSAHQPSLSYLPYLLSGDLFYLDEVMFWATWNLGAVDPTYRGDGLISWNQIRAQAWALRAVGDAAQIVPDRHPAHAYYRRMLDRNLAWYTKTYVQDGSSASPIQGFIPKFDDPVSIPPWQEDFFFLVLARLVDSGETGGQELLRWMSKFTIGRWTHEAEGYCHTQAPAYYIKVKDTAGQPAGSWRALSQLNFPGDKACPKDYPTDAYAESAGGYAAVGRAALAVGADFHIPGAAEAFARLTAETPSMQAAFAASPTWAIVPRLDHR